MAPSHSRQNPPAPSFAGLFQITAALILSGTLLLGPAQAAGQKAKVPAGLSLSERHCGRCHIVGQDRFAGISSTPSFKIMIQALDDWQERFDTFMARKPHPAHIRLEGDGPRPDHLPSASVEVVLTLKEIEAILVYVDHMARELGRN